MTIIDIREYPYKDYRRTTYKDKYREIPVWVKEITI